MNKAVHDRHACLLCGESGHVLVQAGVRHAADASVWRCQECGLVALWPCPSEQELAAYYALEYAREYDVPAVADRYRDDVPEARLRAERVRALLDRASGVLEIGAGSGAFLEAVHPFAGRAAGVEPDEAGRTFIAERLGLIAWQDVTDVPPAWRPLDLIVMFHVLEHLPDPVAFVRGIAPLLAPAGRLAVEVPNVDDALLALYRIEAFPAFYYQKAHLYYFSKATLAAVLKRAGFEAAIEGLQRYDLSNHLRWMLTGRPGGQKHYASVFPRAADAVYSEALVRSGHADTLWAVAWRAGATDETPPGRKSGRAE